MTRDLKKVTASPASKQATSAKKLMTASEAARYVLEKYRETFLDLARYDRGEKPINTISF